MEKTRRITHCRSCNSGNLQEIISLGDQYVTNFVLNEEEQAANPRVPLELVLCPEVTGGCGLLQLRHTAPAESMWGEQYWYQSGINRMIREDLAEIVSKSSQKVDLSSGDIVVDIGCNDGTMLGFYPDHLRKIGFEPSKNVAAKSRAKGIEVIPDFFNFPAYQKAIGDKKPKIISAISMFYDLDDPNSFVDGVNKVLAPGGLFVVQQNYLGTMLSNNAFDNVCHEHLEYYSLRSFENLMARHGMEVFDVEQNGINGGSIRTYIRRKGENSPMQTTGAKERLETLRQEEMTAGFQTIEPYIAFARRLESIKGKIMKFLEEEKANGKVICGCGASTRGNTALQYLGMTPELMTCIFDRNSDKWGRKTIGSMIPVYSPDEASRIKPDYQLVLIWHIFKGLGEDERSFLDRNGNFLLPLPQPKILDSSGERYL